MPDLSRSLLTSASARSAQGCSIARGLLGGWLITGEPPSAPNETAAIVLAEAAREQGVAALLYQALSAQRVPWTEAGRSALRRAEQQDFAFGVRQLDTARRVQDLLAARGVRCLPLKGAALVESLYDSPGHRPMADVDLLVLDEWPRAVPLLEKARSEEHTSELQSLRHLVCRLLLE